METESLSLKEIQEEENKILIATAKFLRDNSLRFFLDSGTLLGAVRHKGFIPWDDDIDLSMPRPDYEKLLALVKKQDGVLRVKGQEYIFKTKETRGYKYPFIKVVNPKIITRSQGKLDEELWIDIFPIDGAPESAAIYSKLFQKGRKMKNYFHIKYNRISSILSEHKSLPNRLLKILLKIPTFCMSTRRVSNSIDCLFKKYNYEESYFCYMGWFCNRMELRYRKQLFDEAVLVEFEGNKYPAPIGYDEYLGTTYGDYMKLPPKEQRKTHGSKAYRLTN